MILATGISSREMHFVSPVESSSIITWAGSEIRTKDKNVNLVYTFIHLNLNIKEILRKIIGLQKTHPCSTTELTTPENTTTYHNALCLSPQNFA